MWRCNSLCRSFRDEARNVDRDMDDAFRFGIPRNEETITETLLLNLARNNSRHELQIKSFTRSEEGVNGADWEFWFTNGRGMGIAVRVQAKRLFPNGRYDSLFHQSDTQNKNNTNQCRELINNAGTAIPIYVFYNSVTKFVEERVFNFFEDYQINRLLGLPHYELSTWGITMCSAYAVQSKRDGKDNYPKSLKMFPWHYLVCSYCWRAKPKDDDLPSLVGNSLHQMFDATGFDADAATKEPDRPKHNFEPSENSPEWVELLEKQEPGDSQKLEQVMQDGELRGVAIIEQPNFDEKRK